MTPVAILARAIAGGVHLWVENGELCLRAPKDSLSPELREALKRHKTAIVSLLGEGRKHAAASFSQRRLWFFDRLEPGRSTYNMQLSYRLHGVIDVAAAESALQALVVRHETLRTGFTSFDDQPAQVVSMRALAQFAHIDLTSVPADRRDAELQREVDAFAHAPFDLGASSLFRAALIHLDSGEYAIVFVLHHIIADGWSLRIVLRDFARLYESFTSGCEPELPALQLQYADFARTQQRSLSDGLSDRLGYWLRELDGMPHVLDLLTDRPRPAVQTFQGAREVLQLNAGLTSALRRLSMEEHATLFMTLLTAFQCLLYRFTGQTDFAVGSPVAGRTHPGTEDLIGFFVNTVVLRGRLGENPSFRELLRRMRPSVMHALEHQDLPFEKLVEELKPERDLSRTAIFQVLFNMLNMGQDSFALPGLRIERIPRHEQESKFDLTLYVQQKRDSLHLALVYNRDLFEPDSMVQMLSSFERILKGIAANPDVHVASISLTQDDDRASAVCVAKPAGYRGFGELTETLQGRFARIAGEHGTRVAVRTRETTWTYAELDREAGRIAAGVLKETQGRPTRIGLLFVQDAAMVAAVLGVLKAGSTYVPLDAGYPEARLRYMLEDAQTTVLLCREKDWEYAQHLAPAGCRVRSVESFADETPCEAPKVDPDQPAYILYTSGSEGKPKGVVQTHRNVLHYIAAYTDALGIGPGDRMTQLSSF
ncbi:MAG: AMP-binding protein, partial [Candidatus Hydrogenedentes bacterium]|nr:AMP-binding protein [Candidatus Hydrogenedentota bacterium]